MQIKIVKLCTFRTPIVPGKRLFRDELQIRNEGAICWQRYCDGQFPACGDPPARRARQGATVA
jgi:hypothetical protein